MKLAKLSLAAIMAVGALSTANAQPLEDAIKGVDFSGMMRYRLDSYARTTTAAAQTNSSTNDWDVSLKFTAPVADNLKATAEVSTSGQDSNNYTGANNGVKGLNFERLYFTYTQNALTVKAGKQSIGTPVTDNGFNGNYGDGVVAMYNLGQVTLAGAYFGGTNSAPYGTSLALNGTDIMAVAAIGSFGAVNAQIWGLKAPGTIKSLIYTQVDGKIAGAKLTGLMINTKLNANINTQSGTYYAVQAGYSIKNFSFSANYMKNDKNQGVYAIATDVLPVWAGWRLGYEIDNVADTSAYGVAAGGSFGKAGVKIGYAKAKGDVVTFGKAREVWGQVSYKYAKNFNTYLKYSDEQGSGVNMLDQQRLRFEAKYSF